MRHPNLVLVMVGLLGAGRAASQGAAPLPAAARLRLSAPSRGLDGVVGTLVEFRSDSLRVRREDAEDTVAVATREVTRLEISRHRDRHTLAGIGIGLAGGALIGAVTAGGNSRSAPSCAPNEPFCLHMGNVVDPTVAGAVGGGLIGALAGGIIGASYRTDRWEAVVLPGMAAGPGTGLRLGRLSAALRIAVF